MNYFTQEEEGLLVVSGTISSPFDSDSFSTTNLNSYIHSSILMKVFPHMIETYEVKTYKGGLLTRDQNLGKSMHESDLNLRKTIRTRFWRIGTELFGRLCEEVSELSLTGDISLLIGEILF